MKKVYKTIFIIITYVLFFSFQYVYAKTTSDNYFWYDLIISISKLFHLIWLPFSVVAWKLLTNKFVYWAFIWMDKILWNVWNTCRNFANFIIAWILIFSIFWLFIWKTKSIVSVLWKLVVAVVFVNLSWFLIWFLVDLSTIIITWAWALPIKALQSSTLPEWKLKICSHIKFLWIWKSKFFECVEWSEKQVSIWDFLDDMNDISWSLVYIWYTILHLNDLWWINVYKSNNSDNENKDTVKVITLSILLVWIIARLFGGWDVECPPRQQ